MGLPYEDWPVREFILCLDDQEWELLRLRQQLLARFGERCIVESLQSPAGKALQCTITITKDTSVSALFSRCV